MPGAARIGAFADGAADAGLQAVGLATVDGVSHRTLVPRRGGSRPLLGLATGILAAIAVALLPQPAHAQEGGNSLQSIEPADGATIAESPTAITLVFNQELGDDDRPSLTMTCGEGELQDTGIPDIDPDRLKVTVAVNSPVPKGTCFVAWVLRDGLGQIIAQDTSAFQVQTDPAAVSTTTAASGATTISFITVPAITPTTPAANAETQGSAGGAVWFGRLLSTLGILVLFGSLALISVGWPEGPEYVVTVRFLRFMWVIALLGTILYLAAFTADVTGRNLGSALSPSAWFDLNDAGWSGRGALLRLVTVAACGWVAMRPERIIDPQSAMWAWAIPGLAVVSVALSRVDGPAAPIGFVVGVAHALAVAIWFGGAVLVARIVLAGPGEEDLVQATRAFSRVSVPAMLVAAGTGIIQVIRLDGGNLFSSSHGRVLLLKVVAVAGMLAVSLAARQQVTLRLDRAHEMTVPLADRFRRAFGAEAALGVVALMFSGWLLALTPAKVDPLAGESYPIERPFNDQGTGLVARVSLGPGRVGLNGLKVEVDAPADGITNLTLQFLPPAGSNAFGIEQKIPLTTSGTAYLDDSVGLPFTVAGQWTVRLFASTATGVLDGAETTFQITDADGNTPTIPPSQSTPVVPTSFIDQSTTTAPFATTTTSTSLPTSVPGTTPSG